MERNIVICTVGTSLFESNLKRINDLQEALKPENWKAIQEAYLGKKWQNLSRELIKVEPSHRICGAEINTIYDLVYKKQRPLQKLYLLVSDTETGEETGKVLKTYFTEHPKFSFNEVEFYKVDKLQDQNPRDFKMYGLRNLVRKIGEIIQRVGGPEQVMIDATGGYKAQIAIAVLIGQVLNIPVSYKHERFSEIIEFPPLPVSFDYRIVGENSDLLTYLESSSSTLTAEDLPLSRIDERLRVFLEEISVDNTILYALSPIGALFLLGYRLRYPRIPNLIPAGDLKKAPNFREDHYPIGFKEYVTKLWQDIPWIITTHSLPYNKQRSIKDISFYVKEIDGKQKLIGTYLDKNGFGARFELIITDPSLEGLVWAADYLNREYCK